MPYTQLAPTATPGRRYSFAPKADASGKGAGPFTYLSVTATPGRRHSFVAKTASGPAAGKGLGPFTYISVTATPGRRHSFVAKTAAPVIVVPGGTEGPPGGRGGYPDRRQVDLVNFGRQVMIDDRDLLDLATIFAVWEL